MMGSVLSLLEAPATFVVPPTLVALNSKQRLQLVDRAPRIEDRQQVVVRQVGGMESSGNKRDKLAGNCCLNRLPDGSGKAAAARCNVRAGYAAVVAAGRRAAHECDALVLNAADDESARAAAAALGVSAVVQRQRGAQQQRHSERTLAHQLNALGKHEQKNKDKEGEKDKEDCSNVAAAGTAVAMEAAEVQAAATTTTTTTMKTTMKTKTKSTAHTRKAQPTFQQRLTNTAITQTNCIDQVATSSSSQLARTQHNRPHGQHAANQTQSIKTNLNEIQQPVGKPIQQKQQQVANQQKQTNLSSLQVTNLKSAANRNNCNMRCPQQVDRVHGVQTHCDGPIKQSANKLEQQQQQQQQQQHQHQHQQRQQQQRHRGSGRQHIGGQNRMTNTAQCDLQAGSGAPEEPVAKRNSSGSLVVPARNNLRPKNHLQANRNKRSLSTCSSLASSASSSPSSSMLQIYSQKELINGNLLNHSHNRRQNHPSMSSRILQNALSSSSSSTASTSSASSTISTCSTASNDSAIRLADADDAMVSLLHSTTNLSFQSSPNQEKPNYLNKNYYHHQTNHPSNLANFCWQPPNCNRKQHQQNQQPEIHLDNHYHYQQYSSSAFFPAPPARPWLHKQQQQQQQAQKVEKLEQPNKAYSDEIEAPEFSVISYNVLCDRMVSNEMFPTSPDIALNWFYRRELILRELLDYNSDIIALQELEMEQYETYFKPQLEQFGNYDSIFEPKSRARTMDCHKRRRVDGCAIFFKFNRFKLIQRHLLEFNQIAMANAQGSEAMLNRVMTKDNIGLAAILQFIEPQQQQQQQQQQLNNQATATIDGSPLKHRPPTSTSHLMTNTQNQQQQSKGRHILVCNTHIHWDPEHCDVKLIQTIMLMNELKCIAKQHGFQERLRSSESTSRCSSGHRKLNYRASLSTSEITSSIKPIIGNNFSDNDDVYISEEDENDDLLPLILLGDFNSLPNSGVTNYLTGGKINSLHKDFKNFKYTNCSNALSVTRTRATNFGDLSSQENNTNLENTNNNTNNLINLNLRRQSSPAWHFYSPSSSPSSITSSTSTSDSLTSSSSTTTTSSDNCQLYGTVLGQKGDNCSPANVLNDEGSILNYNHPFELTSAYGKDTMPYTNYTIKFKAIIDYVFYSQNSFQLLGLLGPLDKNWLKSNRIKGLPQPHLPSDHLPLLVKLKLISRLPLDESQQQQQQLEQQQQQPVTSFPVEQWPNSADWEEFSPNKQPVMNRRANPTTINYEHNRH